MEPMEYVMGIDLGTSSVKAVLMNPMGRTAAVAQKGYEVEIPQAGYAQQDPQIWWERTRTVIGNVIESAGISPRQVRAVGFSGQMHGLVALDREGKPLMPALIWMDQRSKQKQEAVLRAVKEEHLEEQLMNRPMPGMMICSLLWMKEHMPEVYEKTACVLLPKDYIRFRLGGTMETDETDGAGSLAFSVKDRRWCERLLKRLSIRTEIFPPVVKPYEITGRVTREAAVETGLWEGTLLAAGGADSAMQLTGNGVIEDGALAVNIGTASQILAVMSKPVYDRQMRTQTLCHSVPGLWYQQFGSLNGGNALSWLRNSMLKTKDSYERLDEEAGKAKAGCDGVVFLPYLAGERMPYENPDARGVFYGLSLGCHRAHMIRSVMEGVALNLRVCLEFLKETGIQTADQALIVSGGGGRGKTWRQILADVFEMPVCATGTKEEACTGAALMAAVGAKWYYTVNEAVNAMGKREKKPVYPIAENVRIYQEKRECFQNLGQRFQTDFQSPV